MIRRTILPALLCLAGLPSSAQTSMQQIEPVNFSKVLIDDGFWKPKMDKVATTSLQACIYQTETATPRINNFRKATAGQSA